VLLNLVPQRGAGAVCARRTGQEGSGAGSRKKKEGKKKGREEKKIKREKEKREKGEKEK
jgi:hypothetical protein